MRVTKRVSVAVLRMHILLTSVHWRPGLSVRTEWQSLPTFFENFATLLRPRGYRTTIVLPVLLRIQLCTKHTHLGG
jgi:hypothetical protein